MGGRDSCESTCTRAATLLPIGSDLEICNWMQLAHHRKVMLFVDFMQEAEHEGTATKILACANPSQSVDYSAGSSVTKRVEKQLNERRAQQTLLYQPLVKVKEFDPYYSTREL